MTFYPKVSVAIPVFNGANYLSEAIDSALAQTYKNLEVLVINDGSRDDGSTESVALSYGDKIRYFAKDNGGVASALNVATREMLGNYFSWLSHDDLYAPTKIEDQIRVLERMDRTRTILYSDYAVFWDNSETATVVRLPEVPPRSFRYFITTKNVLHGCTLLIPRIAFAECGVFNESLSTTQDYDLWFRMAEKFDFVHMPEVLVNARSHPEQGRIAMKNYALKECNELLGRFVRDLSVLEVTGATGKPPDLSYAEISASMWKRGFEQAGREARRLAIRHLGSGSISHTVHAVVLLSSRWFHGSVSWLRGKAADLRFKLARLRG